jgi:hypothetical protein
VASAANIVSATWADIHTNGSIFFTYNRTLVGERVEFGIYNVMEKGILGVAATTAAKGASVTVTTIGTLTINQTMPVASFDHRGSPVLRSKGITNGTTAILDGVQ